MNLLRFESHFAIESFKVYCTSFNNRNEHHVIWNYFIIQISGAQTRPKLAHYDLWFGPPCHNRIKLNLYEFVKCNYNLRLVQWSSIKLFLSLRSRKIRLTHRQCCCNQLHWEVTFTKCHQTHFLICENLWKLISREQFKGFSSLQDTHEAAVIYAYNFIWSMDLERIKWILQLKCYSRVLLMPPNIDQDVCLCNRNNI